jgi:hypothetical protein
MYAIPEFVEDGGLMAYGPHQPDLYKRAATYVDNLTSRIRDAKKSYGGCKVLE